MPFTPFHLGAGAVAKGLAPAWFSFMVFGFSQVAIDLEPLYFILTDNAPLHRFFHTYVGATVIATMSVFPGRWICGVVLTCLERKPLFVAGSLATAGQRIPLLAACTAAAFGAYSHVFLDSIMHADMLPFSPFSDANPLHGLLSIGELNLYCVIAGLAGAVLLGFWRLVKKDSDEK